MSPIETQLRKVVPEFCVYDVPERVAEVDMSSANPVRGDPLSGWLQPSEEKLVDDEEQRVARVEVYGDIQGEDQERQRGSCCTMRKSSTATSTKASQSAGGSGTRTDAHPFPQVVCTFRARSRGIQCASQTSKTR